MRGSIRIVVGAAAAALMLLAPAAGQSDPTPALTWSPSTNGSYDYGSVAAGQTASQTFTLDNSGHQVKDLTITLTGSAAFTITADSCSDARKVDSKRDCSVTVRYAPASAADTATLAVQSDKPEAAAAITLVGSGALRFTAGGPAVNGLSPLNENPAHPESSGSGTAVVTWDTTTSMMTVEVVFSGLTTGVTASHIHCCVASPGTTGVATTLPTFTGFPSGVTSGTYTHTFDMLAASSYNPAFVTAHGGTTASAAAALLAGLEAGQAYLNIHTTMFPSGELRGFLHG